MALDESKCGLTDRLRQSGLWETASWFRDECRRRLLEEGKTRKEARELAWVEMQRMFSGQNLGRYRMSETLLMGDFPPMIPTVLLNLRGEVAFATVWRIWCHCLARIDRWEDGDFEAACYVAATMFEQTTAETQCLLDLAYREPGRFVRTVVAPKFHAVLDRLSDMGPEHAEYIDELRVHLKEMERFGVYVNERLHSQQ